MPPVVIAAGITAAGAIGGAALASRASNKATAASARANEQALSYTREQEAARRAEYDKAMGLYQQQWNAWNAQRMALLQRYGVDVSGMAAPPLAASGPGSGTGTLAGAPGFTQWGSSPNDPRTRAALVSGATVADMMNRGAQREGWEDWSRYGLESA